MTNQKRKTTSVVLEHLKKLTNQISLSNIQNILQRPLYNEVAKQKNKFTKPVNFQKKNS